VLIIGVVIRRIINNSVVRPALGLYGWARPPCDSPRELFGIGPDCDGRVQWTMNKTTNMDSNNENQTTRGTSTPNHPDQKQTSKKRKQILSEEDESDLLYSRFSPPKNVKIAYMNVNVDLYIPNQSPSRWWNWNSRLSSSNSHHQHWLKGITTSSLTKR
jgi:hypothetical protein